MITHRDILMAMVGVVVTLAGAAVVSARPPVQGSTLFTWESMTVQPTKTGARRSIVQAPTATLDELEMHVTTLNAGETSHAPHQHPDEELLIIKEGTHEALVNGQQLRAGPGSVIFQASNQMHGIRNIGDTPATYHVIRWNSPGMLKR